MTSRGGHGRHHSTEERKRVAARRSTKGPLDEPDSIDLRPESKPSLDDPLAALSSPSPAHAPRTSRTSLSPPRHFLPTTTPTTPTPPPPPRRDLRFLSRPGNFTELPSAQVLAPPFVREANPHFTPSPNAAAGPDGVEGLVRTGRWLSAAQASAARLVAFGEEAAPWPSERDAEVLRLLYTRWSCLCLVGLTQVAAEEAKLLGDLDADLWFDPVEDGGPARGRCVLPWELRVLATRLQGLGYADARRCVMGLYALALECRAELALLDGREEAKERGDMAMWKDRLEDLGVKVVGALVEMGDMEAAAAFLKSFEGESQKTLAQRTRLALCWLRVGDVGAARMCMENRKEDKDNDRDESVLEALIKLGEGDFESAAQLWSGLRERDPKDCLAAHNLAVCLLYTGRVNEARDILTKLLEDHQAFPTLTFNLATLYELCSDKSQEEKLCMAQKIAQREPSFLGWEKSSADFKL